MLDLLNTEYANEGILPRARLKLGPRLGSQQQRRPPGKMKRKDIKNFNNNIMKLNSVRCWSFTHGCWNSHGKSLICTNTLCGSTGWCQKEWPLLIFSFVRKTKWTNENIFRRRYLLSCFPSLKGQERSFVGTRAIRGHSNLVHFIFL